ncbi:pyridoxamine 5'-phosphate oxidase family protein [Rhodococcus sp. HNM0569]|uniref:pyridoxamine 5'-phosphate oxidase family protein n=1 Tax=Rhodococcus sp. HNM0569 TaxID=2716340 RepID=UPI00146B829E|nr:pyridoxamine 5'-phosphate oxidase family protein [Rhodococcus sp. HNM0569]NLU85168.1 pyridoxamine 5'-phosphate oxidase family protein [Rhodococcus sp. HNM0569]
MALTRDEREEFLARPHIAALAVTDPRGRGPLVVPIWYHYEPGGKPWVLTGAGSLKARAIAAATRFTLMVEQTEPTYRYVSVEGPVALLEPGSEDAARALAARYLPPEKVDGFVASTAGAEEVVIHLEPEHWLSGDLGALR